MEPIAEGAVDKREEIKNKLRQCFDGKIVRKDLTKKIKEGANVPVYVLEFLLGQYCRSAGEKHTDQSGRCECAGVRPGVFAGTVLQFGR